MQIKISGDYNILVLFLFIIAFLRLCMRMNSARAINAMMINTKTIITF